MDASGALSAIATQGILGALLVLALVVIAYLYVRIGNLQDKRIEDLKDMMTQHSEFRESIRLLKSSVDAQLEYHKGRDQIQDRSPPKRRT